MRTFEKCAHLRRGVRTFGRAAALGYPLAGAVPIARKVVLPLVAASIRCLKITRSSPQALGRLSRFVSMREGPAGKQKSRAWIIDPDTAPPRQILQLAAVPYFVLQVYSSRFSRVSSIIVF